MADSSPLRFAFAGTAPFAELVLDGLLKQRFVPVVVVTNPDRPRGRRGTPQAPPIKTLAHRHLLPVVQPERVSSPEAVEELMSFLPQVLVVCAYGQILARELLEDIPAIVVHPSLVPRWRGAAPVERALMDGETELGVTILKMTEGVDEGPVGQARVVQVPADADAGRAYELLAAPAADAVRVSLEQMAEGTAQWRPQSGTPSYAGKIGAEDKLIDWALPAQRIVDQVRALSPHIGASAELLGKRTLIWRARMAPAGEPGSAAGRLLLPAGDGWVEVLELQQEGRTRMTAAEFLRGAGRELAEQ